MRPSLATVDAFTDTAFHGNPAAVCRLAAAADEPWMQALAAEVNLPMTAFVVARADGDHDLRWFTPTTEVEICGHAALAAAHVLGGEARFHTRSGLLSAPRSSGGGLELDFPAIPVEPVAAPGALLDALGLAPGANVGAWAGGEWWLVEVPAGRLVRELVPDRARLLTLGDVVVVVFAAPGDRPGVDSVCRVFEPASGIDEDSVTGSAHCALAPVLAERTGRVRFTGEQASARGGVVGTEVLDERVLLRGQAVTVFEGALSSSPP
jgi:predicted PhzF superfamily epimerase YddE/YHI9